MSKCPPRPDNWIYRGGRPLEAPTVRESCAVVCMGMETSTKSICRHVNISIVPTLHTYGGQFALKIWCTHKVEQYELPAPFVNVCNLSKTEVCASLCKR
jgi:hypothetical protein